MTLAAPRKSTAWLLSVGSVVVFLLIWELIGRQSSSLRDLVSQPSLVAASGLIWAQRGSNWVNVGFTLMELVVGLVPAIVMGTALGLFLGRNPIARMLLDPVLLTMNSLPRSLFMPVVIAWFGIGLESKISMAFIAGFFTLTVNAIAGCQATQPLLVTAARSFGASGREIFFRVIFPSTLPYVLTGIRLAVGRAIIAVIVTEMYVSIRGLGQDIMNAQAGLNADRLIFLILLVASTGVLLVSLTRTLERRFCRWLPGGVR